MSTISIKPRPCLQDMPEHIKTRTLLDVLGNGVIFTKQRSDLRLVCKSFKKIIDANSTVKLSLSIFNYAIGINKTLYKADEDGCLELTRGQETSRIHPVDHVEMAIRHVAFFTSNPKLVFQVLFITLNDSIDNNRFVQRFLELLRTRQVPLKVKIFSLFYSEPEETVMKFLPFMNPAYLISLVLKVPSVDSDATSFEAMANTDQWKALSFLRLMSAASRRIPMEKWWNVPNLGLEAMDLTFVELLELLEHLMNSPTFKDLDMVSSCFHSCIERGLKETKSWEAIKIDKETFFVDRAAGKCLGFEGKANFTSVRRVGAEELVKIDRIAQRAMNAEDSEDEDDEN